MNKLAIIASLTGGGIVTAALMYLGAQGFDPFMVLSSLLAMILDAPVLLGIIVALIIYIFMASKRRAS